MIVGEIIGIILGGLVAFITAIRKLGIRIKCLSGCIVSDDKNK